MPHETASGVARDTEIIDGGVRRVRNSENQRLLLLELRVV